MLGLVACGGGGGGGGSSSNNDGGPAGTPDTGSIKGTVSGTTVIAVNGNGDIVASDDTSGKEADANGQYPFTLTGIPVGVDVRVYLVTGGGIYPMYFDSDKDGVPDTNVFSLSSSVDINLGYVNVHVEGQDGRAIAENNPTDASGVSGGNENPDIPESITNPAPPSGASLNELISGGISALDSGWISKANNYFKAAAAMTEGSQNDKDTARFFYAATRVIAVGFNITSDGQSNDLNRVGDLLDRFGCDAKDSNRSSVDSIVCPDPEEEALPANSPNTNDLRDFGDSVVRPEIEGAIADLNKVSSSFNSKWSLDHESFESDYGDALILRAALKGALAHMDINRAYHQNVDIDLELNDLDNTIQEFLADNPSVLTLTDKSKLSSAKTWLTGALDDLTAAVNTITAETDSQSDDLITLDDITPSEALANIADIKASLSGATMMADNDPANMDDAFTLNLSPFFAGEFVDIKFYLPTFAGDEASGPFPYPKLGGILPNAPADFDIDDLRTASLIISNNEQ